MITKEETLYNNETFQVEHLLIHRMKVTDEWMNMIGNKEDLIKLMSEIYKKDLENYLKTCLRSLTDRTGDYESSDGGSIPSEGT